MSRDRDGHVSPSRHILASDDSFERVAFEQLRPLAKALIELALQLTAEEKVTRTEDKEAA